MTTEKPRLNAVYPYTSTGMPPFKTDPKCLEEGFEYEWDRVLRMRKEKDPLIKGGMNRKTLEKLPKDCVPTHHSQSYVLGHEFCQYCHKKI